VLQMTLLLTLRLVYQGESSSFVDNFVCNCV
jgi:hypothetical protein